MDIMEHIQTLSVLSKLTRAPYENPSSLKVMKTALCMQCPMVRLQSEIPDKMDENL